jgi:hypothetical protein
LVLTHPRGSMRGTRGNSRPLTEAGGVTYGEMLNLAVWVKSNAGQGSFYRSQHELVGIFRVGEESTPQQR